MNRVRIVVSVPLSVASMADTVSEDALMMAAGVAGQVSPARLGGRGVIARNPGRGLQPPGGGGSGTGSGVGEHPAQMDWRPPRIQRSITTPPAG